MTNGFANRLIRINLATKSISVETTPEVLEKFLGGKGLGAYLLTKELKPRIDPLGSENKIIISTGPLQGSNIPICGRYCIVTKSPLTGLFLDSHAGGFVGSELKFAGYDAIVIEEKSKEPCYISIVDDEISINPAVHLRGFSTLDKEIKIRKELNQPKARVLSIGLAGENLVKYACVTSDSFRNTGRGGIGAVFGSKNLLAIAICGTKGEISTAQPDAMKLLETNLRDRASTAWKGNHWLYNTGTPALVVSSSERYVHHEFGYGEETTISCPKS